jgi:hypothetical protein
MGLGEKILRKDHPARRNANGEKGVAKSRICCMLILTPCEGRCDFLKFPIPALFADQEEK